jgi:predicted RNase H-like HicB family nuclease
MNKLQLTAVFIPAEEGGYTAYIEEIRGVVTQGETLEETESNLMDAFELMLETEREEAEKEIKIKKNIIKKYLPITV